ERHRQAHVAADVEEELRVPARLRDLLRLCFATLDRLVDAVRQALQLGHQLRHPLALERATQLRQAQRQQVPNRALATEGLRRRDTDLDARARVAHAVRVACRL